MHDQARLPALYAFDKRAHVLRLAVAIEELHEILVKLAGRLARRPEGSLTWLLLGAELHPVSRKTLGHQRGAHALGGSVILE
jgi:hypothetical protein